MPTRYDSVGCNGENFSFPKEASKGVAECSEAEGVQKNSEEIYRET